MESAFAECTLLVAIRLVFAVGGGAGAFQKYWKL